MLSVGSGGPRRQRWRGTLRLRIAFAASIGLILLALVVGATVIGAVRVRRSLDDLSNLHLAAESFRAINVTLADMEASQRGFLLTGDSTFLVTYSASLAALDGRMDSLHRVQAVFPGDSDRFQAVDSLVTIRITQMNATVARYAPGDATPAIRDVRRNLVTGAADSLRATLRALDRREQLDWLRARDISTDAAHQLIYAELGGGLVAIVLLLFALRRIFADLDAREYAEVSLRRSERFLDSIIDLLPLMVYVKDAGDLRFIRFNRTAEQLSGLTRKQALGRDDFDLFPRPLAEHTVTLDRAVLATDGVRDIPEETLVAPNGAVRTLHTRKVAIRDESGRATFLLGVSEDITERKRTETEILRARETAEAANRAKSEFLAKMSHELRTPLNSIIGFSQLLEEESFGPLTERQRRYVDNVLTSGRQLLELINDMLDLSKVEAGRMELSLAHVALAPLLLESIALVEPLAVQAELRLVPDFDTAGPTILADVSRFRQILYNLLGNAIKFTDAGGTVTVRVTAPSGARNDSPMVRISVIDTGVGIRPEDLERIFREFEQVDSDTARALKGTGLGLALARRLAELHGGRLWAESEFGLGSSFHLELPMIEAPAARDAAVSLPASATRGDGPLVLVVEDDADDAELLQRYLESAGYRVAGVANGAEVVDRVSALRPDAITMDVVLPGRDGVAVLRMLKADPRIAQIPVLMVSVVDARVHGMSLGAFDWLLKPVQRDALVARVQQAVAAAHTQHPLVLVVDDDPATLDVVSAILEGAGCRVMTTTDPSHGVHLATTQEPSAIILALAMPDISGFEVAAMLRAHPATRAVPIIIFSGRDLSQAERDRLEQHLLSMLAKPDASGLIDALRGLGLMGSA